MDEKKTNDAISSSIGSPLDVVCMYACPSDFDTQWPNPAQPDIAPIPFQTVSVDLEKIQECVGKIKEFAEKRGSLDCLFGSPDNCIRVEYHLRGTNRCNVLEANADTEVAQGIVELLKSFYENEIIRLQEELKKICGGYGTGNARND